MITACFPGVKPVNAAKTASWFDRLFDSILQWINAPLVRQAAGEVARECRTAVLDHVYPRTRAMSRAQVRGYVRAWAPAFVLEEVDAVLSRRRTGIHLRQQVGAEAVEQLIDMVVDDVFRSQPPRATRAARAKAA
jgi:hypothetical protein